MHNKMLRLSKNRLLSTTYESPPTVQLHTRGRRSGLLRSCFLVSPIYDDHRVVLVAAKGGDDRNPEWYANLVADPEVELVINGQRSSFRARTANRNERAQLWPQIIRTYKRIGWYQTRTNREIPVVICERAVS